LKKIHKILSYLYVKFEIVRNKTLKLLSFRLREIQGRAVLGLADIWVEEMVISNQVRTLLIYSITEVTSIKMLTIQRSAALPQT
jgi:hypothetical protein